MSEIHNPQLQLAGEFVNLTDKHIFLTGKAGTGKTTFLHNLKHNTYKRTIVVAPTGVAAINAGGVTIHSFFQLPFGPILPETNQNSGLSSYNRSSGRENNRYFRFSKEKKNIIKTLDLLVIDEISMVRADLLDAIDEVLRRFRDKNKPFGGVQLLMIGDLQQLAPITKEDEWGLLHKFYETPFFYGSRALKNQALISIELRHIYRQQDSVFIEVLNEIRENKLSKKTADILNSRYNPSIHDKDLEGYITLTTHNAIAQDLNNKRLKGIEGSSQKYRADITGTFPEYLYPTLAELELKKGAQVMFVRNDPSPLKRYFNGKIGKVVGLDSDYIHVLCDDWIEPEMIERSTWENSKYTLDEETGAIEEEITGTFEQYPLKLAWAITIHKSQGLTFDKAIIDANAAFAHGQVYVALSRCRSLEGLVLSTPVNHDAIISNSEIFAFTDQVRKNQPDEKTLLLNQVAYEESLIKELFFFQIISYRLKHFISLYNKHKENVISDVSFDSNSLIQTFDKDILAVSLTFQKQLSGLFSAELILENHIKLQERIKKGGIYFFDQLQECADPFLENIEFTTDNKEVKKALNLALEYLQPELRSKLACLQVASKGFTIAEYLKAKNVSRIEKQESSKPKKSNAKKANIETNPEDIHDGLLKVLMQWRNARAEELSLPHYLVLHQKTLKALSAALPGDMESLRAIHGMGKKKIDDYGEVILEIIKEYTENNQLKTKILQPLPKKTSTTNRTNTREITFNLVKEGKGIAEIATERKLAKSTIEGHISDYIRKGKADILDFLPEEKVSKIEKVLSSTNESSLKLVKEKLGNEFSFGEIKMVLSNLEWNKSENEGG